MEKYLYPDPKTWEEIVERPISTFEEIEPIVHEVFEKIKKQGDVAVAKFTKKYDKVDLKEFLVSSEEFDSGEDKLDNSLKEAIKLAKNNIEKFHRSQRGTSEKIETTKGVVCWREKRPIERVGLYIPGGTAPLFSSVLMLSIPAKLAGCKEIVLCTPPNKEGNVNPAILYTAKLCGVTKLFKIGGIQAIASMTFGTISVPKVHKIFGPGNQFVTVAKQYATKLGVAIDMPAGPSELLVYADETANPEFVAADLLSQAEHGKDSQVILVSTQEAVLGKVKIEIEKQIEELPRKEIAKEAIKNSKLICCNSEKESMDLINLYAPEHFIICSKNKDYFVKNINNAGSVFIGDYTPESAGDYASGTNHTLPTNGFTMAYSGVSLDSFMKSITFQEISKVGLINIGSAIELMAETEELLAHKNAVSIRLKTLRNEK